MRPQEGESRQQNLSLSTLPTMPLPSAGGRRALHHPFFFPLYTSVPPAQPPSAPAPAPSPTSFPKYPSSSSSTSSSSSSSNSLPFFPLYPSPPPSRPPPSLLTFPANISSLVTPSHNAPHSSKLIPIIVLPVLGFILLCLIAAIFFVRRKRSSGDKGGDPGSDVRRLVPPDATSSTSDAARKLAAASSTPPSSEFLYLGTLVNSRGHVFAAAGTSGEVGLAAAADSPELRPLPPLSRLGRRSLSSDDEFYSPKACGGSPDGPRRAKCEPQSPASIVSTPPSSPPSSKPPPPPPNEAPTFSIRNHTFSGKNEQSAPFLAKNEEVSGNPFASIPPRRPPPPPPPPVPHWDAEIPRAVNLRPPVLAPPKAAAVFPDKLLDDSDEGGKCEEQRRPKLKPLHWDKVRASSDRTMVWDHLKSSSFQLNEEMIETLFGCDSTKGLTDARRKVVVLSSEQENMVLDSKKSQNIAILLRALNVTKEEVCEALLEGNTDSLGNELLETLLKMAPSKEEEIKLRDYRDDSPCKLGPAEKFLKAMLDIPFAFKRVDAMLYIANFDSDVHYLKKSFETLELACEELRSSRLFRKLLDAVLKTGNRMNVGTNRGDAQAFKLDTLLKLVDIKGTDGKTTLLHFVVQEISRAEGFRASSISLSTTKAQSNTLRDDLECRRLGLHVVSGLGAELSNVKKAATMDSGILSSYVSKLAGGIGKIREVVRLNETVGSAESSQCFREAMIGFLRMAEGEITMLQSQEGVALSLVREITEYFHGDSAKEEAHPFRIFMVVRDFLANLDQVCKDVGRVNERSVVSSSRHFLVPTSPGRSPVFPRIHAMQPGSSDDDSSSLSSLSS